MITASDLGMLCAKHRIKNASWLTDGIRSWSAPKPPEMNFTKDQKPQAQPNPYAKASEQPFGAAKGLPKANPMQPMTPFASGSAKAQEAAQTAAKPQYDYFRPPTGDFKTEIKPYEYFKPLYDKYPGGYDKAIADAQRWQDEASIAGLHTWGAQDLHNPVDVRGGSFVGPWENRQTPFIADGRHGGFTDKNNPMNAGAYQTNNRAGNGWSRNPNAIMMNPDPLYANIPASNPQLRSIYGHELTHAMHQNASNPLSRQAQSLSMGGLFEASNVFKGHESKFPEHLSKPGGASVGQSGDRRSKLDYMGKPTEFSAHLSELRRHWIENNPGKALNDIPTAEALLQDYNPARNKQHDFSIMVPDNEISYDSAYPRSRANEGDYYKTRSPRERIDRQQHLQTFYDKHQEYWKARKASGVPDGQERIDPQVPTVNSDFQKLLPTIMSDPKLKQKAILQILSSVVQNKQRQAPGTNV